MSWLSSTFDGEFGSRGGIFLILIDVAGAKSGEGLKVRVRRCRESGPVVQPGIPSVCWAEERPVCKFFTKLPEGRGSESRPVHQITSLVRAGSWQPLVVGVVFYSIATGGGEYCTGIGNLNLTLFIG